MQGPFNTVTECETAWILTTCGAPEKAGCISEFVSNNVVCVNFYFAMPALSVYDMHGESPKV